MGAGIGRAIALALADAGADVAITSRKRDDAEPVAGEVRSRGRGSIALALDVRSGASIHACFERLAREWGTIDILVNSAGTNIPTDLASLDEEGWDTVVDTDLKGVAFVTQAPFGSSATPVGSSTSHPFTECSAGSSASHTPRPKAAS